MVCQLMVCQPFFVRLGKSRLPRPPDSVSVSIRPDVVKYIYNHKREVKPGDMRDCLEAFFQSSGNQRVTWWSWEKA